MRAASPTRSHLGPWGRLPLTASLASFTSFAAFAAWVVISLSGALALTSGCAPDKKVGPGESSVARPPVTAIAADPEDPEDAVAAPEEDPAGEAEGNAGDNAVEDPAEASAADPALAAGELAAGEPDENENEKDKKDPAAVGPRKVLILGDSLAATGFGALLERRLDAHPGIACARKARSSSGLARPDFYDWMAEGKAQVAAHKPDLVIVIIGGNDGQDLTPTKGKGKRVHWKSEEWPEAYRERIASFLDHLRGDGRRVLWLGLPRTATVSFEKKLELIRAVHQDAIADLDDVEYLDTIPFFVDDRGELRRTADVGRKRDQTLRADDGIHFTMAGSHYFADQVYPEVLRVLDLDDHE